MNRARSNRRNAWVAAATVVASLSVSQGSDYEPSPGSEPRSDEGVLELTPTASIDDVVNRYGFTLLDSIPSRNIHLVAFEQVLDRNQFEAIFLSDPDIDHSELNFAAGDAGSDTQSTFVSRSAEQFATQPVWEDLGLDAASDVATGDGVVIAIVDTGIDTTDPAMMARLHPAAISFIGTPTDIADVGNGVNDDGEGTVDEMVGHGTWVTGIAMSVAPDALIMPIRALDDEGFGDAFTISKAVYHAIDNGADVINLSLGSQANVRIVERAVNDAAEIGVIVVASAGNQGVAGSEYPARLNKSAGVAAIDRFDVRAPFSSYGDGVLLSAPGVDVIGPVPAGFAEASGTSGATALVSGAAALLIERGVVVRWDDFREFATEATRDIRGQNPTLDDQLGEGALDLELAVDWVGPCFADLNEDDELSIDDVVLFLNLFGGATPDGEPDEDVDYADPRGVWDLADVVFFLRAFGDGCPI